VLRTTRPRARRARLAGLTAVALVPLCLAAPAQAMPDQGGEPAVTEAEQRLEAPAPSTADLQDPSPADETVGAVVETEHGLQVVTVDAGSDELDDVEADLARDPEVVDVVDVFVDVPVRKAASNDTYRGDLWNLDALNIDLLPNGTPTGAGQTVAVLDTGVRASHPDLLGRVDCSRGADFSVSPDASSGTGCTDPDGHGTHVAGIVSAISGNGVGVAGVSAATIMPVRVLDAQGNGTAAGIVAGIVWAVDHDASVINLSIVGEQSPAFDEAIQYAVDNGVVVVAAAGNNRADGNLPQSPASNDGVFAVAATDELGLSAPYSYSGPTNLIAAPGDYVLSTTPTGYEFYSGTSMAAPHVAGIVARYRAVHPDADVETIRTAIQGTAIDLQQPGVDDDTGYGLIDMRELLTGTDAPADPARGVVPAAPAFTQVQPQDGEVGVQWAPPAWDGGAAVTQYRFALYRVLGGEYVPVTYGIRPDETTYTAVEGLVNGATYVYIVQAANARGWGQWSVPSTEARPRGIPAAPVLGTPSAGSGAVRVRWTAGSNRGAPITSYQVQVFQGSTAVQTVAVPGTSGDVPGTPHDVRIGGLTNGRGYTFAVRATNAEGTGPASARSTVVVPRTVPGAPTIGKPAAANDGARVYWRAPADNGGASITGYVVRAWQGSKLIRTVTVSPSVSNALVTGLANKGYYAFTVTAKNAAGLGTPSARSATVRTT
jgi:subtilisin family serine protease